MRMNASTSQAHFLDDDNATLVEHHARRALGMFTTAATEHTRDAIQIHSGVTGDPHDHEVVILVTPQTLELRLPTIEWTHGSYGLRPPRRLWTRLGHDAIDEDALARNIERTIAARVAEFRTRRLFGDAFPLEHRSADDLCHGCASRHHGAVF